MKSRLAALLSLTVLAAQEQPGRIMKPPDKAAFPTGAIEILASGPSAHLELNGKPLEAESPFPNVLRATATVSPGIHRLSLIWSDGRREVQFSSGPDVPAGFTAFRPHPPAGDEPCTRCHQVSRRGRFVFKGGCFDCHNEAGFAKVHTHTAEVLSQCGLCHNAHGSIAKSHLVHTKELACKQCHN